MKTVYAIPNFECNLKCPHCSIHEMHCEYDEARFLDTLHSFDKSDIIILFGGEPTLYPKRLENILATSKITSISTNLISLEDSGISQIKAANVKISTSWNQTRFSASQYQIWLENLRRVYNAGMTCQLLVTLTDDLISADIEQTLKTFHEIDSTHAVDKLLFEHLIADNIGDLHARADEWLCKLHDLWNFSFENSIEAQILSGWKHDCANVFTLLPDGELKNRCPHGLETKLNLECLTCRRVLECQPCMFQDVCTFPHKLYERLKNEI